MSIRSSNGANHLGRTGRVPAVLELAALDDLGPQARSVIVYGPIPLLAYPVMVQIMDRNEAIEQENIRREFAGLPLRQYLNPKEPALDALIAKALADQSLTVMLKDREMDFALQGMKPLRRISREQRRHR
jgi:hypothetical protein